jgi:hypothetical protein
MGEGDVKHMSNHEFVWFLALLFALSGIAGAIVLRLFKHMSLSTIDYREKLSTQELGKRLHDSCGTLDYILSCTDVHNTHNLHNHSLALFDTCCMPCRLLVLVVEMKELQELMEERRYEGRIYAPAGC